MAETGHIGAGKVRRAAHFVHNNYWPLASVTQMISSLA